MGLRISSAKRIKKIVIMGDSDLIIKTAKECKSKERMNEDKDTLQLQ
jgi:CMP-N-acetylneuraminic acid synthetase